MGLLKYLGVPEVIEVFGEKEPERRVMDGPFTRTESLYPEGTTRLVNKYFLFRKEINGVYVRGNQSVIQVCRHRTQPTDFGDQSDFRYENWDDLSLAS